MANFDNIIQEINTNLPDNNTQAITAAKLRTTLIDLTNQIDTVQDDFEAEVNQAIAEVDPVFATNQSINNVSIVNNLTTGGVDDVLSAEQGKIIGSALNLWTLEQGGFQSSDGAPTSIPLRVRIPNFLTGHIKVETTGDVQCYKFDYNLDGSFIASYNWRTTIEINDYTKLFHIMFRKSDNSIITPDDIKAYITINSVLSDIVDLNGDIDDLNGDIDDLNGDIDDLNADVAGVIADVIQYKQSANIHNSAPATVSDTMPTDGSDWYGHNLSGNAAAYNSTYYIEIDPTVGYKSNVQIRRIYAYNANKSLISAATKETTNAGTEITWVGESYANNIAFIRFMYSSSLLPENVKFGKYTDDIDVDYGYNDYDKFDRQILTEEDRTDIEQQISEIAENSGSIRIINMQNSDKLLIVGSSSVASYFPLPLKSWTNKLNDSLDWIFLTYGISGYTCEQLANTLKNDSAVGYADGVKPSQIHPTYVYVGHYKNMSSVAGESTSDNIIAQNRILMEACKSVFNAPLIVGSDYTNEGSYHGEMAMLQLAKELNADYYPFGAYGNNLLRNQNKPTGLWSGAHPGTKTNNFYYQEAYNIFKNLNQPKQSIKVYTPRTGVSDYTYRTSKERNEKFTSVESGNYALMNNQEYYDRINDLPSGSTAVSTGDYYRLMKKDTVTLDSKALVEVIVPVVNAEKFEVYVESHDIANITIKVFNNNTGVYDTITKTNMEGVDGAYITISDVKYVQFDKIKVLLDSESTITINDVYVKCYGGKEKAYNREINANSMSGTPIYQGGNGFGSDWETVWTNGGNCESYIQTTKYGADFEDLPKFLNISTNNIVVLPYNASEKKTISLTIPSTTLNDGVETMLPRLFRVEVYCRTFSKIYNPTAYSEWTGDNNPYTNTPILTSKSYDYTTLGLDVAIAQNNNKVAVFDEQVGQFWSRVLFDVWIPPFTNSDMTFYLYRKPNDFNSDFELQIADVAITRIK
jgi:hypothetical protein